MVPDGLKFILSSLRVNFIFEIIFYLMKMIYYSTAFAKLTFYAYVDSLYNKALDIQWYKGEKSWAPTPTTFMSHQLKFTASVKTYSICRIISERYNI